MRDFFHFLVEDLREIFFIYLTMVVVILISPVLIPFFVLVWLDSIL